MPRWVLAKWFSSLVSFIFSRPVFHFPFHSSLVSSLFVLSCLVFFSSVFSSLCLRLLSLLSPFLFSLSLSSFSSLSLSLLSVSVFFLCLSVLLWLCVVGVVSCVLCLVLWCGAVWCDTIKTSPCVHSKRPRVCLHHAHMLKRVRRVPA